MTQSAKKSHQNNLEVKRSQIVVHYSARISKDAYESVTYNLPLVFDTKKRDTGLNTRATELRSWNKSVILYLNFRNKVRYVGRRTYSSRIARETFRFLVPWGEMTEIDVVFRWGYLTLSYANVIRIIYGQTYSLVMNRVRIHSIFIETVVYDLNSLNVPTSGISLRIILGTTELALQLL